MVEMLILQNILRVKKVLEEEELERLVETLGVETTKLVGAVAVELVGMILLLQP